MSRVEASKIVNLLRKRVNTHKDRLQYICLHDIYIYIFIYTYIYNYIYRKYTFIVNIFKYIHTCTFTYKHSIKTYCTYTTICLPWSVSSNCDAVAFYPGIDPELQRLLDVVKIVEIFCLTPPKNHHFVRLVKNSSSMEFWMFQMAFHQDLSQVNRPLSLRRPKSKWRKHLPSFFNQQLYGFTIIILNLQYSPCSSHFRTFHLPPVPAILCHDLRWCFRPTQQHQALHSQPSIEPLGNWICGASWKAWSELALQFGKVVILLLMVQKSGDHPTVGR